MAPVIWEDFIEQINEEREEAIKINMKKMEEEKRQEEIIEDRRRRMEEHQWIMEEEERKKGDEEFKRMPITKGKKRKRR